jgi:hypothetical protein
MSAVVSVITIGIDPTIEAGPVEIAWHRFTIAIGVVIGGIAVAYDARRRRRSSWQKRCIDLPRTQRVRRTNKSLTVAESACKAALRLSCPARTSSPAV